MSEWTITEWRCVDCGEALAYTADPGYAPPPPESCPGGVSPVEIPVVERSRLERAEAEIKRLVGYADGETDKLRIALRELDEQGSRLERAEEALRFYGEMENWLYDADDPPRTILADMGERARAYFSSTGGSPDA